MEQKTSAKKVLKRLGITLLILVVVIASIGGITIKLITVDEGNWAPEDSFQRYRAAEYPEDKPFFQWWYYSLKDFDTNRTFAFCYSMSRPAENLTYTGVYMMFAFVSNESRGHIYYNFSLDQFNATNDHDLSINDGQFTLQVEGNGVYNIQGTMQNSSQVWVTEGIAATTQIEWDLHIERVVGWYGQADIEEIAKGAALISWNTYAYDSLVNGTIGINGTIYEIERTQQFRMYCDMNWGENFPSPPDDPKENPIDYPWGWFSTTIPAENPQEDFSIIAGIGRCHTSIGLVQNSYGKFAAIYLEGTRIAARQVTIWDQKPDEGPDVFHPSSDGKCHTFRVDRSDWVTFVDIFGEAQIPLTQIVTIETDNYKIVMNYTSQASNYNRLLFPTDGYCFSDFEGLSVRCETSVYSRSANWLNTDAEYTLLNTYLDYNAGVEYGYALNLQI